MSKVYVDLSHMIKDGDTAYPGDPPTEVTQWATLQPDHFALKRVSFGTHSSTHMDAPSHLVEGGKSIDLFTLSSFFCQAFTLDCRNLTCIDKEAVETIPSAVEAVLFFTGWQERWNSEHYFTDPPLLTKEAVDFLLERGVRMFGFDSSSCDSLTSEKLPIHHAIFSYNALILENLNNLDLVVGRIFSLVALPLHIANSDGSPIRVIASYSP